MKRLLLLLLTSVALISANEFTPVEIPGLLKRAKSLTCSGTLMQKPDGYVYLNVTDQFVKQIYPLLKDHIRATGASLSLPPDCVEGEIGAHISVMTRDELYYNRISSIDEVGQRFRFKISAIGYVKIPTRPARECWMITVDARDLENLRSKYRLRPLLKGHSFHITIGNVYAPAKSF